MNLAGGVLATMDSVTDQSPEKSDSESGSGEQSGGKWMSGFESLLRVVVAKRECDAEFVRIGALEVGGSSTDPTYKLSEENATEPIRIRSILITALKAVTENGEIFNLTTWDHEERWNFLRKVVKCLTLSMRSNREDLKLAVCDGFLNLATACPNMFRHIGTAAATGPGGTLLSLFDEVIEDVAELTESLSPKQLTSVFGAIGYILEASKTELNSNDSDIVLKLMKISNQMWKNNYRSHIFTVHSLRKISSVLEFNLAAEKHLKRFCDLERKMIGPQVVDLYGRLCRLHVTKKVRGRAALLSKQIRTTRAQLLQLMNCWIAEYGREALDKFVPDLLTAMLRYRREDRSHMEEIVNTLRSIIDRRGLKEKEVKDVVGTGTTRTIFTDAIDVINRAVRGTAGLGVNILNFFRFIWAITDKCFASFFKFNKFGTTFQALIACIKGAGESNNPLLQKMSFRILMAILNNSSFEPVPIQVEFNKIYEFDITKWLVGLLGDKNHCCYNEGFQMYSIILAHFLRVYGTGSTLPLMGLKVPPEKYDFSHTFFKHHMFMRYGLKQFFSWALPWVLDDTISTTVDILSVYSRGPYHKLFMDILQNFMFSCGISRMEYLQYLDEDTATYRRILRSMKFKVAKGRGENLLHVKIEPLDLLFHENEDELKLTLTEALNEHEQHNNEEIRELEMPDLSEAGPI